MNRGDVEKLLGGYATGTLTLEEREALFAAAMEDQHLFDALAREETLRELLSDPATRAELLAALDGARDPWWRRAATLRPPLGAWAAMAAAVLMIGSFFAWRAAHPRRPVETAALTREAPVPGSPLAPSPSPAPALAPPRVPLAAPVERKKLAASNILRREPASPAAAGGALDNLSLNGPPTGRDAAELTKVAPQQDAKQQDRRIFDTQAATGQGAATPVAPAPARAPSTSTSAAEAAPATARAASALNRAATVRERASPTALNRAATARERALPTAKDLARAPSAETSAAEAPAQTAFAPPSAGAAPATSASVQAQSPSQAGASVGGQVTQPPPAKVAPALARVPAPSPEPRSAAPAPQFKSLGALISRSAGLHWKLVRREVFGSLNPIAAADLRAVDTVFLRLTAPTKGTVSVTGLMPPTPIEPGKPVDTPPISPGVISIKTFTLRFDPEGGAEVVTTITLEFH